MKPRIAFYTFGCRLNQAETATIEESFRQRDYEVVDYRKGADVVVVNTCTVTENGDADTRRFVNKILRHNPQSKIALVGCQAQVQRDKLLNLPGVHWVVGNASKMEFLQILENGAPDTPQVITPVIRKESFTIPVTGIDRRHTRANLKIQDGCDFFCSFCEIPYARGRARSREFRDILSEARKLVAAGHRELILTGINIGTYRFGGKSFIHVIDTLEQVTGLQRIRISSIEPTTIPSEILHKMGSGGKLCRYLHIPLQSGSDEILSLMKRKYTAAEFVDSLKMAQQSVPDICLGTDVIVGFPGETQRHFDETYNLLLDLPLAYFHVFSYSEREHARSSRLPGKVSIDKVKQRSQRLRELSIRKRKVFLQKFMGKEITVLFEQKKNGFWSGLTDNYIRVKVKFDGDLRNRILPVRLERVENQAMTGVLL